MTLEKYSVKILRSSQQETSQELKSSLTQVGMRGLF